MHVWPGSGGAGSEPTGSLAAALVRRRACQSLRADFSLASLPIVQGFFFGILRFFQVSNQPFNLPPPLYVCGGVRSFFIDSTNTVRTANNCLSVLAASVCSRVTCA